MIGVLVATSILINGYTSCELSKTGDQVVLEMGEIFPQVRYSNATDKSSCGGYYLREGFGLNMIVFVDVGASDETMWVEVLDMGAVPELEKVEVSDGDEGVIRLLPAMY